VDHGSLSELAGVNDDNVDELLMAGMILGRIEVGKSKK